MSGRVAPHTSCEVRLIMSGTKPLATIEKDKDDVGYCMAIYLIGAGMLCGQVAPSKDCPKGEVVFTRPKNRALIAEYLWLLQYGVNTYGVKEYHRKMGRLFGYTEEDIEAFIAAEIHCECAKCKGISNS